jgi:hypothetical protein
VDGAAATVEIRKMEKEYKVTPHMIIGLSAGAYTRLLLTPI